MEEFIQLTNDNIENKHICCAFSDKKCKTSYELKKKWLANEFKSGYKFYRLDARAKVFIEFCDAEKAWVPIHASNHIFIACLWVSGKYKGQGYAKALLKKAEDEAKQNNKSGLVTIVGTKKFHFMGDAKWFLKQGFIEVEKLSNGFSLLVKTLDQQGKLPSFNTGVKQNELKNTKGITVVYSNRCPYSEFHVTNSLVETVKKRNLELQVIKLKSLEEAQNATSPATIFSLFYNGKFITTDISVCMDSRFDKIMAKELS